MVVNIWPKGYHCRMPSDSKIILERRFVPKGHLIIEQGDDGAFAFLIQSGEVRVFTQSDGARIDLARLAAGQIFGETALVFDGERTASVEALEDCNLIVITRQSLEQKLHRSDPMIKALVEMLSKRIVSSNNVVMRKQDSVKDLKDTVSIVYQNLLVNLSKKQKKRFEDTVSPKLEAFLSSLEDFSDE